MLLSIVFILLAQPVMAEDIVIKVHGLTCGLCEKSLKKTLEKQKGVKSVEIDLDNFQVNIKTSETSLDDGTLKTLLLDSGYNIDSIKRTP